VTNSITTLPILITNGRISTDTINKFTTQMTDIKNCLELMDYDTGVTSIQLTNCVLNYNTLPHMLRGKFNLLDQLIYTFENLDFHTEYYLGYQYKWAVRPLDMHTQIVRWLRWHNKMKNICDTVEEHCQPLCDINGELTTDVNNVMIYVEAETNG
jgi:hypothetical protein